MVTARSPDRALYAISVAGELTGVDPQMLRIYEARGLLDPARTGGGTRRYSGRDIERIERITMFLAAGLNLAGIAQVFALETETQRLREEVESLRSQPRRDPSIAPLDTQGGDDDRPSSPDQPGGRPHPRARHRGA